MVKWQPGCAMKVRDNKTHTGRSTNTRTHINTTLAKNQALFRLMLASLYKMAAGSLQLVISSRIHVVYASTQHALALV